MTHERPFRTGDRYIHQPFGMSNHGEGGSPCSGNGRVYLQDPDVTLYAGDCLEVLRTLPDRSVHMCATSPPFYGLRDYGAEGQIGLEESPDEWVARLVEVFREVRRVLRDDATLWIEIGDSYVSSSARPGARLSDTPYTEPEGSPEPGSPYSGLCDECGGDRSIRSSHSGRPLGESDVLGGETFPDRDSSLSSSQPSEPLDAQVSTTHFDVGAHRAESSESGEGSLRRASDTADAIRCRCSGVRSYEGLHLRHISDSAFIGWPQLGHGTFGLGMCQKYTQRVPASGQEPSRATVALGVRASERRVDSSERNLLVKTKPHARVRHRPPDEGALDGVSAVEVSEVLL